MSGEIKFKGDNMQSRDELNNVVQSEPVDLSQVQDLAEKIKAAQDKGAVQHSIGRLLKKGETVNMFGLEYYVEFADYVRGKYQVKLSLK
jgi:hypothetical protein